MAEVSVVMGVRNGGATLAASLENVLDQQRVEMELSAVDDGSEDETAKTLDRYAAQSGGTRSRGSHLTSMEPCHGVGDYYYALRRGSGWELWWYVLRRPFREVRTRFHLAHPWWIPVKLIGELRAFAMAFALYKRKPKLLPSHYFAGVSPV